MLRDLGLISPQRVLADFRRARALRASTRTAARAPTRSIAIRIDVHKTAMIAPPRSVCRWFVIIIKVTHFPAQMTEGCLGVILSPDDVRCEEYNQLRATFGDVS
jgi:hypothetical protein